MKILFLAALLATSTLACSGAPSLVPPGIPPLPPPSTAHPPGGAAQAKFDAALAAFVHHDATNDWTPATCASVAALFDDGRVSSWRAS